MLHENLLQQISAHDYTNLSLITAVLAGKQWRSHQANGLYSKTNYSGTLT
jgi:hypothetical protein